MSRGTKSAILCILTQRKKTQPFPNRQGPMLWLRKALSVPHVWMEKTCMVQAPGRALMGTCSAIWRAVSSILLWFCSFTSPELPACLDFCFFFFLIADSDEFQLVSMCFQLVKFYLFWFHVLFHRHSHIDKGIFLLPFKSRLQYSFPENTMLHIL